MNFIADRSMCVMRLSRYFGKQRIVVGDICRHERIGRFNARDPKTVLDVEKAEGITLSPTKPAYSLTDIDNAVAVGEAVGQFELYSLYDGSPLTVSWEFEKGQWTITGEYDEPDCERDYAGEDTLRCYASEEASHATVVIHAANDRRLPECDMNGVPVRTKRAAARKRTPVRRRTKGTRKPT
jgi:hypothetical protein